MKSAFRSKKEVVYDIIRENILNGQHKPGSRLVIDDLAATLGVSQIPIREAISELEADGFVTTAPHVGATVTPIDANFIYEVFALLESMEVICGRAACHLMTDADLEQLNSLILVMDESLDKPNIWSEQNKAMHLFICSCGKTELVYKMLKKVFDHWDRLRLHYLKDIPGNRLEKAQDEHKRIYDAFVTRNPDSVERVLREHNQNALASYIRLLQSAGHLELSEEKL
jgi:DNA-binding GntR family transcriptional regulator